MPLTLTQTVAPTTEPVTNDEAMAHMRLDSQVEKVLIDSLIVAARNYVENYTERQLITATWALKLDAFPDEIRLPRPQVISVSSITYVDTAGDTQTLSSSLYQTDLSSMPGRILPAYGQVWPGSRSQLNAVSVTFTAGYGAASAVPQAIKQAMLLLIAHWFESREAVVMGTIVSTVPMTVDALLGPYRTMTCY